MRIAFEQSKEHGAEARKFTVIFDMDNFSMKQYAYRPAAELVINTFQIYSNNYPEILKYCYVINGKLNLSYVEVDCVNFVLQRRRSSRSLLISWRNSWTNTQSQRLTFTNKIRSNGFRRYLRESTSRVYRNITAELWQTAMGTRSARKWSAGEVKIKFKSADLRQQFRFQGKFQRNSTSLKKTVTIALLPIKLLLWRWARNWS